MAPHAVELIAHDHRWGHMGSWGGGWMWLWGVMTMVLIVALVVVLVRAVAGSGGSERAGPSDQARTILSERYARGELSAEEYRERLSELQ